MSTRSTIISGDRFHIYRDINDGSVYVDRDGCDPSKVCSWTEWSTIENAKSIRIASDLATWCAENGILLGIETMSKLMDLLQQD